MDIKYTVSIWNPKDREWVEIHAGENESAAKAIYEDIRIKGDAKPMLGATPINCSECGDTGIRGEHWGPQDGCSEFMSEPEIEFCRCQAGQEAKTSHIERETEARAEATLDEMHRARIYSEIW